MQNKKFLSKIIPPVVISLASIGLIFVIIFWYILRGTLFDASEEDFLEHAQIYSIIIEEYMDKLQATTLQIASRTQIRNQLDLYQRGEVTLTAALNFIEPKLNDAITASSDVSGVQWLDRAGNLVLSVGTTIQPVEAHALMNQLEDEALYFEGPIWINDASYIRMTSKIKSLDDASVGYNIVYYPTIKLEQVIYRKLDKNTRLTLFSKNPQVNTIINFNAFPTEYASIPNHINTMDLKRLSADGVFVEVDNQALAIVPIIGTPWFIESSEPLIDIYDAILTMLYPVLVLVFILVAIAIVATWRLILASMREIDSYQAKLLVSNTSLTESLKELKRTQDQLIRRETLAALGELVGGLMHELNTPIGTAITSLSFLDSEVKGLVDPSVDDISTYQEAYVITKSNLNKAASNIETFRILNMDQATLEMRRVHIKDYIDEIILSLKPKLKRTHHQIELVCDPELFVATTPGILSQIISNLITNALKHAFEEIAVGHIRIQAIKDGQLLTIVFSDDGVGIPPENLDHIFEPYFTTKRHSGGTGLGLHIIYSLVTAQLGGTIQVESRLGKGTVFTIQFPVG